MNSYVSRNSQNLAWVQYLMDQTQYIRCVCYYCLNNSFQHLNNITSIFTYFLIHTYFHKITTILLENLFLPNRPQPLAKVHLPSHVKMGHKAGSGSPPVFISPVSFVYRQMNDIYYVISPLNTDDITYIMYTSHDSSPELEP